MTPTYTLLLGDALQQLQTLPAQSVRTCVTSPPYFGLRDYGVQGQIGLEPSPDTYVSTLVQVFREVRRVLTDDGTLWVNLGDSYAASRSYQVPSTKGGAKHGPAQAVHGRASRVPDGLKEKDLLGIPWRVAFALQADGWYLRQDIIWHKPNTMPESVRDRCTKAHEYIFLLSKQPRYYFDHGSMQEPGVALLADKEKTKRNRRSVWSVPTKPYKGAHFATFPPALITPCVLVGSASGDTVLDPFNGSGTTGQVALSLGRNYIGIELNPEYLKLTKDRLATASLSQTSSASSANPPTSRSLESGSNP